jgi:hypothetical protein
VAVSIAVGRAIVVVSVAGIGVAITAITAAVAVAAAVTAAGEHHAIQTQETGDRNQNGLLHDFPLSRLE